MLKTKFSIKKRSVHFFKLDSLSVRYRVEGDPFTRACLHCKISHVRNTHIVNEVKIVLLI